MRVFVTLIQVWSGEKIIFELKSIKVKRNGRRRDRRKRTRKEGEKKERITHYKMKMVSNLLGNCLPRSLQQPCLIAFMDSFPNVL